MPVQRTYEIAPLPGKLDAPIPSGRYVFGDRVGDLIMGRLRTSGSADAGCVDKKVYLANFTFPTHDLDPRNLTRISATPNGFYPSVLIFERKEAGKGFIAFCTADMPTQEAAQKLIATVIDQGIIKREVRIVPGAKKYLPITPEQKQNAPSVSGLSNGFSNPNHSEHAPITNSKGRSELSLQERNAIKEKYFLTFTKAMSATSTRERLLHYDACKVLGALVGVGNG